jgi:hypothetical protein
VETSAARPLGTVILEAGQSIQSLIAKLDLALIGREAGRHRILIACPSGEQAALARSLPDRFRPLPMTVPEAWPTALPIDTQRVAFLPAESAFSPPLWDSVPPDGIVLRPWPVPIHFEIDLPSTNKIPANGWAAPSELLRLLLQEPPERLGLFDVADRLAERGTAVRFLSTPAFAEGIGQAAPAPGPPPLRRDSSVLAIVPHYRCEAWLEQCLRSLVRQTRPLQAIVVVDDASPSPPLEIVAGFPAVTLLAARENVGPYRLVQTVIERTRFDAYLFQDADDWSSDDRLALLLDGAERMGAALIGCQEVCFDEPGRRVFTSLYPADGNRLLGDRLMAPILHPSSLVSRSLVMRLGGYASGMKFGGDYEFQLRAHHVARLRNIDRYCYFRRRRPGSLWTSPETGNRSPVRRRQTDEIEATALANARRAEAGLELDLAPFSRAGPIALDHLCGPALG